MPISSDPGIVPGGYPYQLAVPLPDGTPYALNVMLQSDGTSEPDTTAMDQAIQSLVDLFQGWEGKREGADVTGGKVIVQWYDVRPTNPVPPPPES